MQLDAVVYDFYGVWGDRTLTIAQYPRVAIIAFTIGGERYTLNIVNPEPYKEVVRICDSECCHILVLDQNREEPNFLEYARYRVELRDEDNPIRSFVADCVTMD